MRYIHFLAFAVLAGVLSRSTTSFAEPPGAEAPAAEAPAAAAPKPREPIYQEDADGKQLVAEGLERARLERKHVLVVFGGNWCGWCYKLHDVFEQDQDISQLLFNEYEVVLVDVGANKELLTSYGEDNDKHGVPFLTVLDADGAVLVNQNTGDLEDGSQHDVAKVLEFLGKWIPETLDAQNVYQEALADAQRDHKRVFLQFGAPGCGWCRVLTKYLHDQQEAFADQFVIAKIDTERMTHGAEVSSRFRTSETGIPWFVILDEQGDPIVDCEGPQGNIGYPVAPHEIAHFLEMIKTSAPDIAPEKLTQIEASLRENAKTYERPAGN